MGEIQAQLWQLQALSSVHVDEHDAPAADAGDVRGDGGHAELCCDGGVDGVAALGQDVVARLRAQRVVRDGVVRVRVARRGHP